MPATLEERKNALLDDLYAQVAGLPAVKGVRLETLIRGYYRHVDPEDLIDRSGRDLGACVLHHFNTAERRPQGTALVDVLTPLPETDGWGVEGRTVIEVVTDDMPFLVDSVTMALDARGHEVHLVVHPQFVLRRTLAGDIAELLDDTATTDEHDVERESWMHIEIDRVPDDELDQIREALESALHDVREAVEDWPRMANRLADIVEELRGSAPPLPADELAQGEAFLRWLGDNHFTFLGYREYDLDREGEAEVLHAVPGTGYGILRFDPPPGSARALPPAAAAKAREQSLLVLAKASSRATVHRPVHLDYVGIKKFDEAGEVCGERRFLGLYSSGAYAESVTRVPLLREKAAKVITLAGYEPMSHAGKAVMDVLEGYPRDELLQTPAEDLVGIADAVAHNRERRQLRLFCRRDTYGRFLSCLVYLPRDRYNTRVRERLSQVLRDRLGAESVEFTARVSESYAARLHFVARPAAGADLHEVDTASLESELAEAARSWSDDLSATLLADESLQGPALLRRYSEAFPEAYKEDYDARTGAADLTRLSAMGDDETDFVLAPDDRDRRRVRLKVFRTGSALSLSEVLPTLTAMGVEVVDERPYALAGTDLPTHIYDFGLRYSRDWPDSSSENFVETVRAVWDDRIESDGFNALVLAAGLSARQAMLLRAYARYMRQGTTPFSQEYIEETLSTNVDITALLVRLFEARFDPGADGLDAQDSPCRTRCRTRRGPRGPATSRNGSSGRWTTSPDSTGTGSCAPTSP